MLKQKSNMRLNSVMPYGTTTSTTEDLLLVQKMNLNKEKKEVIRSHVEIDALV